VSPSPTAAGHTTSTYTHEGLTLLSLDATSEEGTAAASWRIDYLTDATGRPYGGIYTSSETLAVAFGIVTTDRGDVRELTDGAGAPFARYDHDAYGNPTRTLSAATPEIDAATAAAIAERNILRYAGYAFDEHSGLYYLSQRYYDPATCQFITKDPAKADGEESAYQYCGGDPVGKVDPSGERHIAVRGTSKGGWLVTNSGATQYSLSVHWRWDGAGRLVVGWTVTRGKVLNNVMAWAYYRDAGGVRRVVSLRAPSGATAIARGWISRVGQRTLTTGWAKYAAVGIILYGDNMNEGSGVQSASNLVWANPFGSARRRAVTWCH